MELFAAVGCSSGWNNLKLIQNQHKTPSFYTFSNALLCAEPLNWHIHFKARTNTKLIDAPGTLQMKPQVAPVLVICRRVVSRRKTLEECILKIAPFESTQSHGKLSGMLHKNCGGTCLRHLSIRSIISPEICVQVGHRKRQRKRLKE